MIKKSSILLIFIILACNLYAQQLYNVRGKFVDANTGDELIGATVLINPQNKGFSSDVKGEFAVSLPSGDYTFIFSYMGYKGQTEEIKVTGDLFFVVKLVNSSVSIDDVDIVAKKPDDNITSNKVGVVKISGDEIAKLPGFMGEPDIVGVARMTPGIQSGGEGNPGIFVRGGNSGQNLILLDYMPLYNPSHLMGFFPVFNSDAIEDVEIMKGAIPANFGGKTASVFDISLKEADYNDFSLAGSVGLISGDLTINTPIIKNKLSLSISGRVTYFDMLKSIALQVNSKSGFLKNTEYYFYDTNLKLTYKLNHKNKLFLTAYKGKDEYTIADPAFEFSNTMDWGNSTAAVRFNHVFNNTYFADCQVGLTNYNFNIDAGLYQYNFEMLSDITDVYGRVDFQNILKNNGKILYGIQYTRHQLTPNKINIAFDKVNFNTDYVLYSEEYSGYTQLEFSIGDKISSTLGGRYTVYNQRGPFTQFILDNNGDAIDSIKYAGNSRIKTYSGFDPNISLNYIINKSTSIKSSASYTHQFIHLASVGSVSLPTDLWLPSTEYIEPQKVGIVTLGLYKNFKQNRFESYVEAYYKKLYNQIDFLYGVLNNTNYAQIESNVVKGIGQAYGLEFYLKKQFGDITGWISYTLSRTERQFKELNDGIKFPEKYDRTHDLSVVLSYQATEKLSFSATFIYATGNAMTLPAGRYMMQGNIANDYTEVNGYRMPSYHRLDFSATYNLRTTAKVRTSINFSVYNLYNRKNPYFIYFSATGNLDNYQLEVQPHQISLFPIIPSFSYIVKIN